MEDYYKLLGVQPDDARETIRDAYRAKKAELDAQGSDAARAQASKLNRAWNVLSDDGQRGRYDDQLADARAEGNVEESPEFEIVDAAPAPRRGRERQPRQLIPQETEINGVPLASNKDRGIAFAIDAAILFLLTSILPLIIAQQFVSDSMRTPYCIAELPDSNAIACRDKIVTAAERASDAADDAEDKVDAAKDAKKPQDEIDELEAARKRADAKYDDLIEEYKAVSREIRPLEVAAFLSMYFVGFLILFVPTAVSGRSPGKMIRRTRLLREAGSPVGFRVAFIRYFAVIGSSAAGLLVLGPQIGSFIPLIWMFGITSFARNPRRQGWHDRLAKTIVAQG